LHHVHGGIVRGADRRRTQLPSPEGRHARNALVGESRLISLAAVFLVTEDT
jgi:hypothetical protein